MKRLLLLVLAVGCGLASSRAADSASRVRFAHGWLHDTSLDIEFEWGPVVEGLGFGQVTDYIGVEPTKIETFFALPGRDDHLWGKWLDYWLQDQTLVALGEGSKPWGAMLRDDNSLPEADQARLRLVGASTRLGKLTAEVSGPGGSWPVKAFAPGQASDYLTVPAGPYQVRLHQVADDRGRGSRLKTFPPVPLSGGCVYSAFAFGAADVDPDNPRRLQLQVRLDAAPER